MPGPIKAVLVVLIVISSLSVPITSTNAALTDLQVSPEVVVQGEKLAISGLASPGEEVWLTLSFELFIPVSEGTYSREFRGLYFPPGVKKSFSVKVMNIRDIRVEIYPIFGERYQYPDDGPLNATGGIARFSVSFPYEKDGVIINPGGEKDVLVYGEALAGATSVNVEVNMSICVTADSDGSFELNLSTKGVPVGEYVLSADGFKKTVQVITPPLDTGSGTYPSLSGVHHGSIKPNQTINVSQLYTYPCPGTGGHTESVELYDGTILIANGTWAGYVGDWHNVTLHAASGAPYVTLVEDHEYTYTLYTGSYPQIIHKLNHTTVDGSFINCTSFIDANGRVYDDWIPAIKLIGNSTS